nr:hypothetical protein [Tanacetum cinerariifolium]
CQESDGEGFIRNSGSYRITHAQTIKIKGQMTHRLKGELAKRVEGTSSSLRKGSVSDIGHVCVQQTKSSRIRLTRHEAAEGAPESLGDSAHIHGPSSNSQTRERTSLENQISSQVHSRFNETTANTTGGTNTAAPQRLNTGPEVITSGPSTKIWTILRNNGTLTWLEKTKFTIELLLAYLVGKRVLRLKMGECLGLDETANWINFIKDYLKKRINGFIDSLGIDIPLCHILGPSRMMADTVAENSLASSQSY